VRPPCNGPRTPREFMQQKLNSSVYDKTRRPVCSDRGPTVVDVQLRLLQVSDIDQKLGIVSVSGFLHTWWTDLRLAYNGSCVAYIAFNGEDTKAIWSPDLYIDNLVRRTASGFPASINIDPMGNVQKTEQVKLDVKNALDLGKLPYDKHTAKIVLASYSQDISAIRVRARGGELGPSVSGVGIKASPMKNNVWEFAENARTQGFETPGDVTVSYEWDYLRLSFPFERKPKFLIDQVIVPAILFLLVSYIQFWVDPTLAPARAALAVIPVLIMRTLSDSVYRTLPEGSQQMWLTDNLSVLTFLCVIAAVEFGAVEFSLVQERSRARKHEGLKKSGDKARLLMKQAADKGCSLHELLQTYKKTEKPLRQRGNEAGAPAGGSPKSYVSSPEAAVKGVQESDLLFIEYTKDVFDMYDRNHSSTLNSEEVRKALTYFNIYVSRNQAPNVICMFLRDAGEATPEVERSAELNFAHFCGLLLDIDRYKLKHKCRTIRGKFQSIAPSKRWDVVARWLFPFTMIIQQILFQACLKYY